tara:strand:- start:446 stop:640 length:195 start_codon:yes stop_codon:yes gene_type:complete
MTTRSITRAKRNNTAEVGSIDRLPRLQAVFQHGIFEDSAQVINAQITAGFVSPSAFRTTFSKKI